MIESHKILKEAIVSEKASDLCANLNKYTFEVYPQVNKTQVAKAIEKVFSAKVVKVNILNKPGKRRRNRFKQGAPGRTPAAKRAVVTLAEGHKIELVQ